MVSVASTGRVLDRLPAQQPLGIAGLPACHSVPQVTTEGRLPHQRRSQRVDKQRQTQRFGDRIQVLASASSGDRSRCSQPAG